jgi:hypothetical protein
MISETQAYCPENPAVPQRLQVHFDSYLLWIRPVSGLCMKGLANHRILCANQHDAVSLVKS